MFRQKSFGYLNFSIHEISRVVSAQRGEGVVRERRAQAQLVPRPHQPHIVVQHRHVHAVPLVLLHYAVPAHVGVSTSAIFSHLHTIVVITSIVITFDTRTIQKIKSMCLNMGAN